MRKITQFTIHAVGYLKFLSHQIKVLFPSSHYALLALLYFVSLEIIFTLRHLILPVVLILVGVVTAGTFLVKFEEKGRFSFSATILPILATTGLGGFAFLLPNTIILHVYIILAGLVLFFLLKYGTRQAYPIWNWLISLLIYFLNIASVLGIHFYLYLPVLLLLSIIFIVSSLTSWQSLLRLGAKHDIITPVLIMAFVLTELAWTMQFLPSHYLVQAGILTTAYYVMFNLISLSLQRKVAKHEILEYTTIGLIAIIILLATARWT